MLDHPRVGVSLEKRDRNGVVADCDAALEPEYLVEVEVRRPPSRACPRIAHRERKVTDCSKLHSHQLSTTRSHVSANSPDQGPEKLYCYSRRQHLGGERATRQVESDVGAARTAIFAILRVTGVLVIDRSYGGRRFLAAAVAATLWSGTGICASPALGARETFHETYCPSGQASVTAFHAELNAGAGKDMTRLATKAEFAAQDLISCAKTDLSAPVIERDRLRVRAADALFIAAVARYRISQPRREVADLTRVLQLIADLDPMSRTSNEHLYQESRLLQRLSAQILGKIQS